MNFNFHPPYSQYMQPGHFIQPPQGVNVLPPQAVNVPQQVENQKERKAKEINGRKLKRIYLLPRGKRIYQTSNPVKLKVTSTVQ